MSINPFEFVDSVGFTKRNLIREAEDPAAAEREYNPFIVNRALSYHIDAIHYANEMNFHRDLGGLLAVDFLINTLRKRKRFAKWAKPVVEDDVGIVMEYHGYNRARATEALRLLTSEQLDSMRATLERGGRDGRDRRLDGGGEA